MQQIDPSNTLFSLASQLVNHTSKHIFLTGKAGTGKTTFLKHIRETCPKQMAVVAPTGVAAINAGGVTIHSFFQLPFSPFIPEARGFTGNDEATNRHTLLNHLRINSERRKVIQELELLVIDEISMVRCDVLDAIDLVLRHVRYRQTERFGGVQVLFIGDMYQLPPVVREPEWRLLRQYYESPYFFDSYVLKEDPPVHVEFTRIYRQTEEKFINLLNQVRNNTVGEEGFKILQDRFQPQFFGGQSEGHILLTTHNETAKSLNAGELEKLSGRLFTYEAKVEGEFPATAFPAEERLQLKVGAQVMFIKNDMDKGRRYFNGRIGVVTALENEKITVQCKGDQAPIEVKPETWENIRYMVNKATRHVEEEVLGSFSQYPLRLAWAITIHKSQGLTFEKAVIDAGEAFAPGQVYVALSRCTNLEGMILHSKVQPDKFYTDRRIVQFSQTNRCTDELQRELTRAKKAYQEKVLLSLFEFKNLVFLTKEWQSFLLQQQSSFNPDVFAWSDELVRKAEALQAVADKFHPQLLGLFGKTDKAEDNGVLQERLKAAAVYFCREIKGQIDRVLQSPAITDSRMVAKEYNERLKEIFTQLSLQNFLLQGCGGKLNMETFHRRKKSFVVPSFPVNAYAGAADKKVELAHPALYYELKKLRDSLCAKKNLPIYMVAGSATLEEMTTYLPHSIEELGQITGFGMAKLDAYGDQFLAIVQGYCRKNGLSSNMAAKSPKGKSKERKGPRIDTKEETYRLYREGKTVPEIAAVRKVTVPTVEGHLTHYVRTGVIKLEELVDREKISRIKPLAENFTGGSITPLKEALGSNVSFSEIRWVLAAAEFQKSLPPHVNH